MWETSSMDGVLQPVEPGDEKPGVQRVREVVERVAGDVVATEPDPPERVHAQHRSEKGSKRPW